jgi:UDP-perosamine 4-acetyltransferase
VTAILVAGAGGHAGMVIDTIRALGRYEIVGLVERKDAPQREVHGLAVIGTDDGLPAIFARGIVAAANGVGSVKDNEPRRRIFERLKEAGFAMPVLVHPRAWVAESAVLGDGVQVMPGALVLRCAVLGDNVLVNSGAIIEHDSRIGAHTHICTGVRMGGQVTIGEAAFIGVGTSVRQGIRIGAGALIGAGSVVIEDVPEHAFVAGVPARRIR